MVADLEQVTGHLRTVVGVERFDDHVAHGATMTIGQAAAYSRTEIRAALDELTDTE